MAQNNGGPHKLPQITAATFSSKFNSKREVYNFLTIDVGAYLPAYDTVTIYYLK